MKPTGQTIRSLIDKHAENTADKTFVFYPETGIKQSWLEFQLRAKTIALQFSKMGLSRNEPISGLLGNGQAALELFLGGMYGGYQVFLANPLSGADILTYVLEHSEAKILFVSPQYEDLVEKALLPLESRPKIIKCDPDKGPQWEEYANPNETVPEPSPDDQALLIYTSGTTGRPKGVIHTHQSLLYGGWNTAVAHKLSDVDRGLCVLPFCHINAQVVSIMATLVSGSSLVVPNRFQVSKFWSLISENECTWFSAVPTILSYLMNAENTDSMKFQMNRVRFGRSASAPLPPALHKSFEARFGISIVETMGITETAAQLLSNPLDPKLHKYGSPGIAFGNEVRIADENGSLIVENEEGEVQVNGINVMQCYLKNEEATQGAFTPDGWYRTGDLGRIDEQGYVFITGRLKELIIKGGENIAPREIDDVLYRHESVLEAAAFALPDEHYGQRVAAAIAPRPGENVEEQVLRNLCQEAMGEYRAPSQYYFMDELPKGPSGKIQRLKLSELFAEKSTVA